MSQNPSNSGKSAGSAIFANPDGAAPKSDLRFDMTLRKIGFDGARAPDAKPMPATSTSTGQGTSSAVAVQLARREWLLGTQERQRRLSALAGGLLRTNGMDSQQFLDHFYAPGRPCVIGGAIDHWPALSRWTPAYLRETVGKALVEFQGGRDKAGDFELAKDRHKQRLPFTAYMDLIENNPGNDAYVTAYNSAANVAAFTPLMADVGDVPCALGPGQGMLWVGPGGTFTPLHFDLTNNLLIQITGRKHVHLIAPADTRYLYHNRHVFSDVHDIQDAAQLDRHPLARQARPYDVVLEPGDMLYIPIGWWHQVRSLDFSVMMTCTNFLWPNEGYQDFPSDRG